MKRHTQVVPYRWTKVDSISVVAGKLLNAEVTPYGIPTGAVNHAFELESGQRIELSLGLSHDPPKVARFFREGYEWVDVPEEVEVEGKFTDLFTALYDHDKRRFAHFEPRMNTALTADRARVQGPALKPWELADPGFMPFGDLAALHFDYWENTDFRAQVINEFLDGAGIAVGAFSFPAMWLTGGDPVSSLMTVVSPLQVPVEKNGEKIVKVLARAPMRGVPIKAIPTVPPEEEEEEETASDEEEETRGEESEESSEEEESPGPKTITVMSLAPPRIELDGFHRQTLTPVLADSGRIRASTVRFRITLPVPVVRTKLQILHNRQVYYEEEHRMGEFLVPGTHIWSWDGYDEEGVFDTSILRSNRLRARITTVDQRGRVNVATTTLGTGPHRIRWADARIDTRRKTVEVTVFARFAKLSEVEIHNFRLPAGQFQGAMEGVLGTLQQFQGGTQGAGLLGMVPGMLGEAGAENPVDGDAVPNPAQMLNTGDMSVPLNLPPLMDLEDEKFARLRSAVIAGVSRHWSRAVTMGGEQWQLFVSCRPRRKDAQLTLLTSSLPSGLQSVGIGDGSELYQGFGSRSVNLASVAEGLPIVNIWDDADDREAEAREGRVSDVDALRAYTGAHELGHSVLRERGSFMLSLTHKGTSNIAQQALPTAPKILQDESEIDLMHYFGNALPRDWQDRMKAAEEDALGLIAMAQVSFG